MNIPPLETLSPSGMEKFEQCPLRYSLENLWKIKPEGGFTAAVLGNFVHEVLENLLNLPSKERNPVTTKALAREVYETFIEGDKYKSLNLTEDEAKKFRQDAWRFLGGYFKIEDPSKVMPLGIEMWVSEEIEGIRVRGIIDRLDSLQGGLSSLVDYKTGKAPAPRWVKDKFKAMHIYAMLLEDIYGQRPSNLRLLYLSASKDFSIPETDQNITETRTRTHNIIEGIQKRRKNGEFETNVTKLCDWCPFQAVCPAWGGNMDALMLVAEKAYKIFQQEEAEKAKSKSQPDSTV